MTDLRDRPPGHTVKTATDDNQEILTPRQTLVSRALAPIRRVSGFEPSTTTARQIDLRVGDPLALEPERQRQLHPVRWSLIAVVLMPMLLTGLYLFAFASDQYVAEARFAIRQADPGASTNENDSDKKGGSSVSASSILSGASNLGGQDAEIVADYIHSRAVIDSVSKTVDVRAIFQRPEADFWARLPSDASAEDLTKYWSKMVSVYIEASSGIVTVSASAFRREDALTLVKAILQSSDALVNSMSAKIRQDQMKTAEDEVRRSESDMRKSLSKLTAFRNSEHLIDPVKTSEATGKLLLQLMSDKIETEGQLFVVQRTQGPDAPGLNTTKAKLESINIHVKELQDQLAGSKSVSSNMAATISKFEELELEKQFAERMYGFARDGIERARLAAIRQSVYLAVFVPPSLPQDFTYPLRWADFFLISIGFFMIWICGATMTASVLDHKL